MASAITTHYSVSSDFAGSSSRRTNIFLWTVQGLLAALFLFAGSMKLITPLAALEQQAHMSGVFLRFIGVCEVLGALGLVLPGLTRIRPSLTSLAATGLAVIMVGATWITVAMNGVAMAVMPFVVGALAAIVAGGRFAVAYGARR
jgi:DoxX-like protein